jgi:cytochrome c5
MLGGSSTEEKQMRAYRRLMFGMFFAVAAMTISAQEAAAQETKPSPANPSSQRNKTANDPAPSRGELLYENHCTACHASKVHLRENRRATSAPEVEAWVRRWASDQKLTWSDEEVGEVTTHLVRRYYKFDQKPARK